MAGVKYVYMLVLGIMVYNKLINKTIEYILSKENVHICKVENLKDITEDKIKVLDNDCYKVSFLKIILKYTQDISNFDTLRTFNIKQNCNNYYLKLHFYRTHNLY